MATIPTARPKYREISISELVERVDPGQQAAPEVEYEFGRRKFKTRKEPYND